MQFKNKHEKGRWTKIRDKENHIYTWIINDQCIKLRLSLIINSIKILDH